MLKFLQQAAIRTPYSTQVRSAVNWLTLMMAAVILIVIRTVWFPEVSPSTDVDTSYRMILNAAHELNLEFGSDLVITWGPLAFLAMPDLHPVMSYFKHGIGTLVYLSVFIALGLVIRIAQQSTKSLLLTLFLVNFGIIYLFDPIIFFFLPIVLYVVIFSKSGYGYNNVLRTAIICLVALAALTKFTYLILGLTIVGVSSAYGLLVQKNYKWDIIVFLGMTLLIWVLSGQTLSSFLSFVTRSFEIASAYGSALSLNGGKSELVNLSFFLLSALIIAGSLMFNSIKEPPIRIVALVLIWGSLGLICLKTAFVRYSFSHLWQGTAYITILGIACSYSFNPAFNRKNVTGGALTLLPAILPMIALLYLSEPSPSKNITQIRFFSTPALFIDGLAKSYSLFKSPSDYENRYQDALKKIRQKTKLPSISGSVDLYPDNQSIILAYDLEYKPRASYQSVNTVTSKLSKINSSNLLGTDAPNTLLFNLSTIDRRLPALGENLSWPIIWTNYRQTLAHSEFLILQRSPHPQKLTVVDIDAGILQLEDEFELPEQYRENLWIKLEVTPTLLGSLASVLYKLPILRIALNLENGDVREYRFLHEIGDSGFLLSPLIENKEEFGIFPIASGIEFLKMKQVRSFSVHSEWDFLPLYKKTAQYELYQNQFSRNHLENKPSLVSEFQSNTITKSSGVSFTYPYRARGPTFLAHRGYAPYETSLAIPPEGKKMSMTIEIEPDSWMDLNGERPDGVDIVATQTDMAGSALIHKVFTVDPIQNPSQRSGSQIKLTIDKEAARIHFDIKTRKNGRYDTTIIYNIEFES